MSLAAEITAARVASDRIVDLIRKAAGGTGSLPVVVAGDESLFPDDRGRSAGQRQYQSFRGHSFTAISAIAKRIAGQRICVAYAPGETDAPKAAGGLTTKGYHGPELDPLPTHPLLDVLESPNPLMVYWGLMFATVAGIHICGRAYWWWLLGEDGPQVWPIPAHWIKPADPLQKSWLVYPRGQATPIPVEGRFITPFHFMPAPNDSFECVSPMQANATAVDTDELIQRAQIQQFGNGYWPTIAVRIGELDPPPGVAGPGRPPELTAEQRAQLVNAIIKGTRGMHNHGTPIILDALIKDIFPIGRTAVEMDYFNASKMSRGRIHQGVGVNPLIFGEIEGANRAQATVAEESFCTNAVNPIIEFMGQTMTRHVGPLFAGEGRKLIVWIDPCRAKDPELRLRAWTAGKDKASVNEWRREMLGLPAVAGGDEIPALAPKPTPPAVPALPPPPPAPGPAAAGAGDDDPADDLPAAAKRLAAELNPYSLAPWGSTGSSNGRGV